MATKVERLLFTRKRLLWNIEVQTTAISTFTENTAPALQISRKDALKTLWAEFKEICDTIETTRDWVGTDEWLDEYDSIHEKYLSALVTLLSTMLEQTEILQQSVTSLRQNRPRINVDDSNGDTTGESRAQSTPNGRTMIKLPATIILAPLPIKPFDGNALDWPEFRAHVQAHSLTSWMKLAVFDI